MREKASREQAEDVSVAARAGAAEAPPTDRGMSTDRQMIDRASAGGSATTQNRASYLKGSVVSTNSAGALNEAPDAAERQDQDKSTARSTIVHQFLRFIDIYPIPIQVHVQSQFKQPTFCGGALSIMTYLVLTLLIVTKGYSILAASGNDGNGQVRRLVELEVAPSRFLQSADAGTSTGDAGADQTESEEAPKVNFNFWTYQDESFNGTTYATEGALPVSSFGIKKVEVVMNMRSFQDQYDGDMVSILDALGKVAQEDIDNDDFSKYYTGNKAFDQALVEEIRNYVENKPFTDLTRFYSRRWNETSRDQRLGTFMDDGAPLGNVLFEVEIKKMVGKGENSTLKKEVFAADDFDWSVPYRPTLDITKHINVKGDFFAESEKDERTITTFRMIADYETLVKGVYDNTLAYFRGFTNHGEKYEVGVERCGEFDQYSNEPNLVSDAERQAAAVAWGAEKAQKILDFSKGFEVFDAEYFRKVAEYEAELDAGQAVQWTQDVKDRLAARDEAYPNRDYPVYPTDFLAELDEQSKLCYNITIKAACIFAQTCPDGANYAMPVYTRFIDKFD